MNPSNIRAEDSRSGNIATKLLLVCILLHLSVYYESKRLNQSHILTIKMGTVVIVWYLQLPMQSVPILTKVVSSKIPFMTRCTRYNIM